MMKAHMVVPGDKHDSTGIKVKTVVPIKDSVVTKTKRILITFEDSTSTLVDFNAYVPIKKQDDQ